MYVQLFLDSLLDTVLDTLKLVPFLFLTYLLIEYLEHKASNKLVKTLSKLGGYGSLGGALLGLVPQCGFSVAAANLYSGGIITAGTLAAVFISTNDEAIPILLSSNSNKKYLLWLLLIKFILAAAAGLVADLWLFRRQNLAADPEQAHELIHSNCEHGCSHHGTIFKSALFHTLNVMLFIFIVMLVCSIAISFLGIENIANLFVKVPVLAPFAAALIGFIPNCASSIVLTELFVGGALPFGALIAGLVTNTGIALMVLFKSDKISRGVPLKMSAYMLVIAILSGFAVQALIP